MTPRLDHQYPATLDELPWNPLHTSIGGRGTLDTARSRPRTGGRFPLTHIKGLRGDTGRMVEDTARDRAIYHALKAADEVAAALQAHLIEEHGADPDRTAAQNRSTNSLKLLRQARERLGQGLRPSRPKTSP